MKSLAIIPICIALAAVYGAAHNQVTARVCIEYFTIGHPAIFNTDDPTLLGLGWGVLATWWVGLLLGVGLAVAARAGSRPQRSLGSLVSPVAILLVAMAVSAAAAGIIGWMLASHGAVFLVGAIAANVPADKHAPFIADLWAHSASYLVGFLGGMVVMVRVWRSRSTAS